MRVHPQLASDELATAAALWAAALPDPSSGCGGDRSSVPRFPLRDLLSGDAGAGAGLASLLARHSFVVLTLDAGQHALAERYATMEREGERFFAVGDDRKRACASSRVHRNERGVPMWHCGYERCAGREAFRVDAPAMRAAAAVASGERCADDASVWPSRGFAGAWTDLAQLCRAITDAALVHVMRGAAAPACEPSATPLADDLSVCYALHYPNTAAPVASECVRGDQVWNVAPHVDPSLLVVEPCSRARGLEVRARSGRGRARRAPRNRRPDGADACQVQDVASGAWVRVDGDGSACAPGADELDAFCAAGRDLVLFAGRGLETATGGRVRACPHRVAHAPGEQRFAFIFEQKYAQFYDPPDFD